MKDPKETLEAFKEAIEEGNVQTPLPKSEDQILLTDGHATLSFSDMSEHFDQNVYSMCMADGGGFSSLLFTEEQWAKARDKMDAFIASSKRLAN